jgi:hypothetical protein
MITTYELALRMRQAGRSEEEIVPILQKITGKDKPGSADPIPKEIADQLAPQMNEGTIAKVAEVAQGAGFRPDMAQADALDPAGGPAGLMSLPPDPSPHPENGTVGGGDFMSTPTGAEVSPAEDIDVSKSGPMAKHTNMGQ